MGHPARAVHASRGPSFGPQKYVSHQWVTQLYHPTPPHPQIKILQYHKYQIIHARFLHTWVQS